MNDYLQLLGLVAPVFMLVLLGLFLRRGGLLSEVADQSVLNLVVKVFYPCLIIRSIIAADSLDNLYTLAISPLAGFAVVVFGGLCAWGIASSVGFKSGAGLRTFCFSVAVLNYGYIPIPLVSDLYGENELAVLFVFNAGVEFGIWTLGIAVLSGASWRTGLAKTVNPSAVALVLALIGNLSGVAAHIPNVVLVVLNNLADCAVPVALIIIGATLSGFVDEKESPFELKTSASSVFARLLFIPFGILLATKFLPLPIELKRVLVIQAAMPAGIMPIVLAKHYDGQPVVAIRVVIATTAIGAITIPFVINFGKWFVLGQ